MARVAHIERRPIHPMLVFFPVALLVWAVLCEFFWRGGGNWFWYKAGWYSMGGGLIGAVVAALFGFNDFMAIRDVETKRKAATHMLLNVIWLALFIISFFIRLPLAHQSAPPANGVMPGGYNAAFILSLIGVAFLAVSGWIGMGMVFIDGMAVDLKVACEHEKEIHGAAAQPAD